jgi:hypothetical protein
MKFRKYKKTEIRYMKDVKKIRKYLSSIGDLEATDSELNDAWHDFSEECYAAGWMVVDIETLKAFADWLEEKL